MTNIFLGYPPEYIKNQIIEQSSKEPAGHEKTWIWFNGQENYEEFDWSGEITKQTMIDARLFSEDDQEWSKPPVKVEIGTNVTDIGERAFEGCWGLTSITIPDSVTNIGEFALYYCTSLTSVTIPNSVTSIGESVFIFCSRLTTANFPGFTEAQIRANAEDWSLRSGMSITASDGTFTL